MAVTPNYYETLYITRPDIQEEDLAKIQQKLLDSISAHQGEVIKAEKWAERGLAYEIQDHKRGTYYILVFKALPSACAELEKHLSFYNTDILRFMTLAVTEEAINKDKAAREKAAQKAEAQKAEAEAKAQQAESAAATPVVEAAKEEASKVVEPPAAQQTENVVESSAPAAPVTAAPVEPETQQAESAEEPATEGEGGEK